MSSRSEPLLKAFHTIQNKRKWRKIAMIELEGDPRIHHPQGLKVLGDRLFISTVDKVHKRGFLFRYRIDLDAGTATLDGRADLSNDPVLAKLYHCGGIEWDGQRLLVPMSEYRAYSESRIIAVDPDSLKTTAMTASFPDHFGALAIVEASEPGQRSVIALNWDSKNFYEFDAERLFETTDLKPLGPMQPQEGVAYQDCKHLIDDHFVCGGKLGGWFRLERGVLDLVHFDRSSGDLRRVHRVYVSHFTADGRRSYSPMVLPLTHNTFDFQFQPDTGHFRFFFAPHDGPRNKLFVFEASSSFRRQILMKLRAPSSTP